MGHLKQGTLPLPGSSEYAKKIMDLGKVSAGRNPPKDIHAVIEIPYGGVPVKYEFDKNSGGTVCRSLSPHGDVLPR